MQDTSFILLNGTFTGTLATGAGEKQTKYLKDAKVAVDVGGKLVEIPVRGFGSDIEGAESLFNQQVLIEARYALEPGKNGDQVFGNLAVVSLRSGFGESLSEFTQTGYVDKIEDKGALRVLTLEVTGMYWDKASRSRKSASKTLSVAFFGDAKAQLDGVSRGEQVMVRGTLKTSGEKNYLDFEGERVFVLGAQEEIDIAV